MKIEKTCSLCGKKFVCECNDDVGCIFAEIWEICPNCWLEVELENENSQNRKNRSCEIGTIERRG